MKINSIRRLFCLAATTALVSLSTSIQAQEFPSRPITLVVGFAPGGSGDILARIVGQKLSQSLGQPVVVDNRPGAGGTIATSFVASAPGDGYSLLFVTSGFSGSTSLYPKLNYDTVKSFAPVAKIGASPVVIIAPADSPFTNLQQVLAAARRAPGKLNYASGGGGATTTALAAEFLKAETRTSMQMIPYKGSGPAITALLGKEVDLAFDIPSSSLPSIRAGKLRAIAVTTQERSPVMPEVPTVAEQGVPNFEVTGWFGVLAPAATPPAIVERLHREINAVLGQADVQERLRGLGVEPSSGSSADFAKLIATETQRYGDAIRRLGLRPE